MHSAGVGCECCSIIIMVHFNLTARITVTMINSNIVLRRIAVYYGHCDYVEHMNPNTHLLQTSKLMGTRIVIGSRLLKLFSANIIQKYSF